MYTAALPIMLYGLTKAITAGAPPRRSRMPLAHAARARNMARNQYQICRAVCGRRANQTIRCNDPKNKTPGTRRGWRVGSRGFFGFAKDLPVSLYDAMIVLASDVVPGCGRTGYQRTSQWMIFYCAYRFVEIVRGSRPLSSRVTELRPKGNIRPPPRHVPPGPAPPEPHTWETEPRYAVRSLI